MTVEEIVHQAVVDMRKRQRLQGDVTVVVVDAAMSDEADAKLAKVDFNDQSLVLWLVGTPWQVGRYYHQLKTKPVSIGVSDHEALNMLQSGAKLWIIDDIPARISKFPFYGPQRGHYRWQIVMGIAWAVTTIKEAASKRRKNGTLRSM